jgi:hypothetical protein
VARDGSNVFLNIPFDKVYEPIFIGLVGALVHLGKRPTTVLELGGGAAPRMNRLINAIRGNTFSVHDLSRVEVSGRGAGAVPRFNMPFETGLAVAWEQIAGKGHCRHPSDPRTAMRAEITVSPPTS